MPTVLLYVGTYTGPKSQGIYSLRLDLASGTLTAPQLAGEATNPSFLALHPSGRFLYAVGEVDDFGGRKSGSVSAFAIDPESSSLTLLNQQSSEGASPCHVIVDAAGKNVLVANYGGGSVCVLPIGQDGRLEKASAFIQHTATTATTMPSEKQPTPHAHSINVDSAGRIALVADLGLDKIFVYDFDSAAGKLTPHDPPAALLPPKTGPRHLAFHPTGRFVYVINESTSTLSAFHYDAQRGTLTDFQTISTLPDGFKGNNLTADVQVHSSGKFLYASNRGHDSIAVFTIDPQTGRLTSVQYQPTQGKGPRGFGIDPTGQYLLAANHYSNTLVVFKIDAQTGTLKATGTKADVPSPVCVKFLTSQK